MLHSSLLMMAIDVITQKGVPLFLTNMLLHTAQIHLFFTQYNEKKERRGTFFFRMKRHQRIEKISMTAKNQVFIRKIKLDDGSVRIWHANLETHIAVVGFQVYILHQCNIGVKFSPI